MDLTYPNTCLKSVWIWPTYTIGKFLLYFADIFIFSKGKETTSKMSSLNQYLLTSPNQLLLPFQESTYVDIGKDEPTPLADRQLKANIRKESLQSTGEINLVSPQMKAWVRLFFLNLTSKYKSKKWIQSWLKQIKRLKKTIPHLSCLLKNIVWIDSTSFKSK